MEQGAHWLAYYTDQGIEAQQTRTTEADTYGRRHRPSIYRTGTRRYRYKQTDPNILTNMAYPSSSLTMLDVTSRICT